MIDTHCPNCDADIEKRLMKRVFDGAGLHFEHTCDCGQVLDVDVETYIEFNIKAKPEVRPYQRTP